MLQPNDYVVYGRSGSCYDAVLQNISDALNSMAAGEIT